MDRTRRSKAYRQHNFGNRSIPSGIRPDLCAHPISPPQVYTPPGSWPQRAVCGACGANVHRDAPLAEWVRETVDLSAEIPGAQTEFGKWWRGKSRPSSGR